MTCTTVSALLVLLLLTILERSYAVTSALAPAPEGACHGLSLLPSHIVPIVTAVLTFFIMKHLQTTLVSNGMQSRDAIKFLKQRLMEPANHGIMR